MVPRRRVRIDSASIFRATVKRHHRGKEKDGMGGDSSAQCFVHFRLSIPLESVQLENESPMKAELKFSGSFQ